MLDDLDRALLGVIGAAASDFVDDLQVPQPGQTVAHYRIVEQIGAGGMGVVCKAIDTKLDRTVALKFVQATGASDQERLEREARAASALNHPDICTVHDFHQERSYRFIVMEHLEGETLRDRLARGPLPEAEAVALVLRVAAALAAAHERNIVHCDLKPGNIFLTRNGAIKVLDFGIARRDGHKTTSGRQQRQDDEVKVDHCDLAKAVATGNADAPPVSNDVGGAQCVTDGWLCSLRSADAGKTSRLTIAAS
jgi:serine/threonine protein kinase